MILQKRTLLYVFVKAGRCNNFTWHLQLMEENNQHDLNNGGKASPDPTRLDHYSPSALAFLWHPAAPQHFASGMWSWVMIGQEAGRT